MTVGGQSEITDLVTTMSKQGVPDDASGEELMLLVYPNLRRLARKYLSSERRDHTLQPTAVVHEAYCKLVDQDTVNWRGRTHFFAVGARIMRRVLIDHARGRNRAKRGGDWLRVSLADERQEVGSGGLDMEQLLTLNSALERLARLDARQATILELRFFGGLTMKEVAGALGVSKRTVEGDWMHAKAWMRREMDGIEDPG